jgi:glucose-6-phosphate isomerase
MLTLDILNSDVSSDILESKYNDKIKKINKDFLNKKLKGSDFTGWLDWPERIEKSLIEDIQNKVSEIKAKKVKYLLVIGIGGSYLGSRALQEAINGLLPNNNDEKIIYIGNTMSSTYISQVYELMKENDFAINVISKSGTTLEPALSFRIFKDLLEKKLGNEEASKLIVATTDHSKGALKQVAIKNNYKTFDINEDIGGRFSVFTPVGLFPLAFAGVDIYNLVLGAKKLLQEYKEHKDVSEFSAFKYAASRHYLYTLNYKTEILVSYELQFQYLLEWWKQLFGESEGKEGKALFPASAIFSTDLHSLGQYIQDGQKTFFETVINIENPSEDIKIPKDSDNLDGLNYVTKKSMHEINSTAFKGVVEAHWKEGQVNNLLINLKDNSAKTIGYFVQWMFMACMMSAYLLEVNPFDQPGVEVYKKSMFKLLKE